VLFFCSYITLVNDCFFPYTDNMNQSYTTLFLWVGILLLASLAIYLYKLFTKKSGFRYKSKGPYLLSKGEKVFFDMLIQSISPDLYICPKVRVADLIEVDLPKSDKKFWASFNKISKKHVDFVLCNRTDFAPVLVIELDGGSHKVSSRSQRDIFINDAFAQAMIPILHIPTAGFYDQNQITLQIKSALSDKL